MSGLFQSLQNRMPKPLLLGLYGAVGCFLGGLLLGEPLWTLLVPPPPKPIPPPPPIPELRLSASGEVLLDQRGKNKFSVRLARDHFSGPVTIACGGLPTGVRSRDVTVAEDAVQGVVELEAAADAAVGTHDVTVRGSSGSLTKEVQLRLTVNEVKPPPPPQVDVLFVLDVTGSMQWAINGVRDGIRSFAGELSKRELDARVGMIAFRDRLVGEEPQILLFNREVFTNDYDLYRQEVGRLVAEGGGDIPESSLDAIALAVRQPFRRQAVKVVLLITDVPPKIPDKEMRSVEEVVTRIKAANLDQLHLVTNLEDRTLYEQLQRGAAGRHFDLQKAGRGAGGFAGILPTVSKEIARVVVESKPASELPPQKPAAEPPPLATVKAVQSSQQFAAEETGRLVLAISVWTAVLAAAVCLALMVGQNYYLRGSFLSGGRAVQGVAGGLFAGLLGGVAGQMLYQMTAGGVMWDAVFRAVAWALLGSLIGLGMAFFVPNLRPDKGVLGGAVGGALEALGFLGAATVLRGTGGGDLAGRLVGAGLLGFCIGLMVAWAERLFRRAWLEIRNGPEVRTVNLGPEPITLGSDARLCTVYARNTPPVAFRYWLEQGELLCEDIAKGQRQKMRAGEEQSVGPLRVRACMGVSATAPPQQTIKIAPPPPPRTSTSTKSPTTTAQGPGPPMPAIKPPPPPPPIRPK